MSKCKRVMFDEIGKLGCSNVFSRINPIFKMLRDPIQLGFAIHLYMTIQSPRGFLVKSSSSQISLKSGSTRYSRANSSSCNKTAMNINAMLLDVKSYYLAVAVQVTGTFNLKSLCL